MQVCRLCEAACLYASMFACIHLCRQHVYICVYGFANMHKFIFVKHVKSLCVHVSMYANKHIHMYVYIYIYYVNQYQVRENSCVFSIHKGPRFAGPGQAYRGAKQVLAKKQLHTTHNSGHGAVNHCIESCTAIWRGESYPFWTFGCTSSGCHPTLSHQYQTHLGRETQVHSLESVAHLSLDQTTGFDDETTLLNLKCS